MPITSTPQINNQYKIKTGDTLSGIANIVYGNPLQYPIIHRANLSILKDDDPDLIFPGEIIFIPPLADFRQPPLISQKEPDQMTFVIGGKEITPVSARVIRTMDTAADGWSCTVPWTPTLDPDLDSIAEPWQYLDSYVFIGNKLIVSGPCYSVSPSYSDQGRVLIFGGASYTADTIDSTMRPPYQAENITLEDWSKELLAPFGIKPVFESSSGGKFDRVFAEPTETVFSHLVKLAKQKGMLISSDSNGDMLFLRANLTGNPVDSIVEDQSTFGSQEFNATFDGRKRFQSYKAIGQSPGNNKNEAVSVDSEVNRPRFRTFQANDLISGEMQVAADWEKGKAEKEAMNIPFPVTDWYDSKGNLWEENTSVSVTSATIFKPNGFNFLIRQVDYILENQGRRAELSLVPPSVYG